MNQNVFDSEDNAKLQRLVCEINALLFKAIFTNKNASVEASFYSSVSGKEITMLSVTVEDGVQQP